MRTFILRVLWRKTIGLFKKYAFFKTRATQMDASKSQKLPSGGLDLQHEINLDQPLIAFASSPQI